MSINNICRDIVFDIIEKIEGERLYIGDEDTVLLEEVVFNHLKKLNHNKNALPPPFNLTKEICLLIGQIESANWCFDINDKCIINRGWVDKLNMQASSVLEVLNAN